jgi:hypothetical protein
MTKEEDAFAALDKPRALFLLQQLLGGARRNQMRISQGCLNRRP